MHFNPSIYAKTVLFLTLVVTGYTMIYTVSFVDVSAAHITLLLRQRQSKVCYLMPHLHLVTHNYTNHFVLL